MRTCRRAATEFWPITPGRVGGPQYISRMTDRIRRLLVVLLLLVAACGDDGSGGADGPTYEEALAAGETLVDRWDDRLAFYAVVAAFDRGYSAEQVIQHPADVAADGTIPGVDPDGPAAEVLSPITAGGAPPPGRVSAAPRRLVAGPDGLSPQNQYINFIDATLGEVYDAGLAHLQQEADFQQSVVEMTILLGASGYSVEQIVEALILDSWDIDLATNCYVIVDGPDLVTPRRVHAKFVELLCPGVFTDDTTTTSSSTTTTAGAGSGDDDVDGHYLGTGDYSFTLPNWEVLESAVDLEIDEGSVAMTLVYTLDYAVRYINDEPSCVALVRATFTGSGTVVGSSVEAVLDPISLEILNLEGSDCDVVYASGGTARDDIMAEFAAEGRSTFNGIISNGVLTGNFGGFFDVVATRG